MGRFFLFALLTWITGSPLLAILILIALAVPGWLAGSRYAFRVSRQLRSWGEAGRLRRVLATNPHDAKARADLGALLAKRGRYREARAELEQAYPRVDDLSEPNYALGLCLLHAGEVDRGTALIRKALAINPKFGYGEPALRLGDFAASRGEWEQAAGNYREAVGVHGSSVEGWAKLGEALVHLGRPEEARRAFSEAVTSYRTAPWYRRAEDRPWKRRAKRGLRSISSTV